METWNNCIRCGKQFLGNYYHLYCDECIELNKIMKCGKCGKEFKHDWSVFCEECMRNKTYENL